MKNDWSVKVTTEDGRELDSWSEEYRNYCEARWVFKRFRTKNTRQKYLEEVRKFRGEVGRQHLYNEMMRIHKHRKAKEENNARTRDSRGVDTAR